MLHKEKNNNNVSQLYTPLKYIPNNQTFFLSRILNNNRQHHNIYNIHNTIIKNHIIDDTIDKIIDKTITRHIVQEILNDIIDKITNNDIQQNWILVERKDTHNFV